MNGVCLVRIHTHGKLERTQAHSLRVLPCVFYLHNVPWYCKVFYLCISFTVQTKLALNKQLHMATQPQKIVTAFVHMFPGVAWFPQGTHRCQKISVKYFRFILRESRPAKSLWRLHISENQEATMLLQNFLLCLFSLLSYILGHFRIG